MTNKHADAMNKAVLFAQNNTTYLAMELEAWNHGTPLPPAGVMRFLTQILDEAFGGQRLRIAEALANEAIRQKFIELTKHTLRG